MAFGASPKRESTSSMAEQSFDIVIIGAGPGGYVAAIRAAQLGFKTAIVERDYLGGICLNWGCIPTKALLRSAEVLHYLEHAKDYGLVAEKVGFDAKAVVERSRTVAKRLNEGVAFLMRKNKIAVIWGEARRQKGRWVPAAIRPSTSSSPRARGRVCWGAWSPTRSSSGPTSRRWLRIASPSRCW
jgi:dihydrolipoamide dehydrogenase